MSDKFDVVTEAKMIKNQIERFHSGDESALNQASEQFCKLSLEHRNATAKQLEETNKSWDWRRTNAEIERDGSGKLVGIDFASYDHLSKHPYVTCDR